MDSMHEEIYRAIEGGSFNGFSYEIIHAATEIGVELDSLG